MTATFKEVKTPSGKQAFEAFSAIWKNARGEYVVIGAPTLELLKTAWKQITGVALDATNYDHSWIIRIGDKDHA